MESPEITLEISNLQSSLYTLTRRFTSNPDESLDLVQETLLKALRYKDKFREGTNLKGWLFTIMRNTFINEYRKEKKAKAYFTNRSNASFLHQSSNVASDPAEFGDIWKQVNSLPEELLVPFKMHLSGYKYHEIAGYQRIPIGTVKNRIFHARKEIQKKLVAYQK